MRPIQTVLGGSQTAYGVPEIVTSLFSRKYIMPNNLATRPNRPAVRPAPRPTMNTIQSVMAHPSIRNELRQAQQILARPGPHTLNIPNRDATIAEIIDGPNPDGADEVMEFLLGEVRRLWKNRPKH